MPAKRLKKQLVRHVVEELLHHQIQLQRVLANRRLTGGAQILPVGPDPIRTKLLRNILERIPLRELDPHEIILRLIQDRVEGSFRAQQRRFRETGDGVEKIAGKEKAFEDFRLLARKRRKAIGREMAAR